MSHRYTIVFLLWSDNTRECHFIGIYGYGEIELAAWYRFSLN